MQVSSFTNMHLHSSTPKLLSVPPVRDQHLSKMAGKIFWILACNQEMRITPLPPASHCPAHPTGGGQLQLRAQEQAVTPGMPRCLWHAATLFCSPCMSGTLPQSPGSTHHSETLPVDTGALATNLPEKIQATPTAPSEALSIPIPSLPDNSLVEAH